MQKTFTLAILLVLVFTSCSKTNDLASQLTGKWNMVRVVINGESADQMLNPDGNRWLAFQPTGNFTSGSGKERENGGTYELDPTKAEVFLDSDAGEGDDSRWQVSFSGDTLFMRGVGTARQESSLVTLLKE
ncbi:MAG: hypothetical protein AAFQ37_05475 [Bacteroidota bacterium]